MQLEPMLTTKEVAALLNVDPMTICKWRYGRKPSFPLSVSDELLDIAHRM